ncbi:MAG: EF-P beta-lysylation protein EpmB [Thermoanaerobaculales bacterium]|nr:EF-P beta-lysylation protein EpmB [Thermoanaerobaculales bacterium]
MTTVPDPWPAGEWRRHLSGAIRDLDELLETLELDAERLDVEATLAHARRFPLRVPRGFVGRMRPGDPNDPLLRQVLPTIREGDEAEGFTTDPVGELGLVGDDGTLSKYRGRALVVATGACAVHCRYCFRRHFPYDGARSDHRRWESALAAVAADETVEELILSGGDPLMLGDGALAALAAGVSEIPHLRRLRVHTRMPVVLPERVDEIFVDWIEALTLPVIVVIHANHPNEIDGDVRRAVAALRAAGATLLNQSVLLAGVNDDAGALAELSKGLIDCGVLPYYLHLLDRVAGAAHFEVDEGRAVEIMSELRQRLPGYLVPRLVREVQGAPSKVVIA